MELIVFRVLERQLQLAFLRFFSQSVKVARKTLMHTAKLLKYKNL